MSTTSAEFLAQKIFPPNAQQSIQALAAVKFYSACFAGAVAGILGLQNWLGFALLLASTALTSACIVFINCGGKPGRFVHGGWSELVNPGQDNASSFILVWTLFYGVVHVYD